MSLTRGAHTEDTSFDLVCPTFLPRDLHLKPPQTALNDFVSLLDMLGSVHLARVFHSPSSFDARISIPCQYDWEFEAGHQLGKLGVFDFQVGSKCYVIPSR
ncbi:hypothetical protein D9758_009293 [Tetrapyrgos nigripes]|uniref:Uncharacterized protein n=1 Tax=Tetrapyrgos nigripes TaxID=182062 RepID=A0A8H5GHA6_9AGAR|nr:hypothetical protein D9758_009293 [Tetrapyrgos nigripes]